MRINLIILSCLTFFVTGCKEKQIDPLRLDHTVEPISQRITLSVDPDKDTYHGSQSTEIAIKEPTSNFRLHARDLGIIKIWLTSDELNEKLQYTEGEKGTLTVKSSTELQPGNYSLHINFTNDYNRQGIGIYKAEYESRNYLFTQMEPEHARESIPCWDAPEFKIPWELQLIVPTNFTALSNTPIKKNTVKGEFREVVFEQTKPMPSYLLALAVGEFDKVPVAGLSIPGNIYTAKDKTKLAGEAVRISAPLLKALEAYFEYPHPYKKLDQIAVPEFNAGAMENVGLITYRDTILLQDPKAMTLTQKQWLATIVAHEMAHMWFGNLVTPAWWDDLWLNESFASWIALKMVNQVYPEYEMANDDIHSRQRAMGTDARSTSKPIRRPVAAADPMGNLFDALAYNKGMAVLDMIETWLGSEKFRQGMVQYMKNNAWSNADVFDLAESLDPDALPIMESFVTQAGIPLLQFKWVGKNRLQITQSRYNHLGVDDDKQMWLIPVSLTCSDGKTTWTQELLLSEQKQIVEFEKTPIWFHPNTNEKGYYRWQLPLNELTDLAQHTHIMEPRMRMGYISNLSALFNAGKIDVSAYLDLLSSFNNDPSSEVRKMMVDYLNGFAHGMVTPDLDQHYGQYLTGILSPMLDQIGIDRVNGEDIRIEKLRTSLVDTLGWRCSNPKILQLASQKAQAYIAKSHSVDPALAESFLRLAALKGDAELFTVYTEKHKTSLVPTEKMRFLRGLSGFRDTELMQRALEYVLSENVAPHQFRRIPEGLVDTDDNRKLVLKWLMANYSVIEAKVPDWSLSDLPWFFNGQSLELLEEARSFLFAEERKTKGMEHEMGEVEADVHLHAALRKKELENLRRFLNSH